MTRFERAVYVFFNSRGRKILRELIITMCAGDPFVLTQVRLQHVILKAEKYVSELPLLHFVIFKIALYMVQFGVPPLVWKLRPFTWLPLESRLAYIEQWQGSRVYFKRALFKFVTLVCVTHLYSEKKLLESIGFGKSMEHRTGSSL